MADPVAATVLVITRAEMARRLGVSRTAVTRACRAGSRLAPACSGTGINVLHDAARRWLAQRSAARIALPPLDGGIPVDADEAADVPVEPRPTAAELERDLGPRHMSDDLNDLAAQLTAITERWGEARIVQPWVRCRKMLEEARKAEMLRARIEGRLIARTTVVRMVDHVDVAFRILLSDAPRTIATRLSAPDLPAAAAMIRDVMSQLLEAARDNMTAALEADDPMVPLMEAAE